MPRRNPLPLPIAPAFAALIVAGALLPSLTPTALAYSPRVLSILSGAQEDFLGVSVSDAGDVNGDGYADVIVGADQSLPVETYAGRASVYYGGPSADTVADLALTGAAAGDFFGSSVSGAGDVNGDGYADVIVGAYGNDAGGMDAGRAYVYYGGPGADAVADLTLTGATDGDCFGVSVSGAGDMNGDGYVDVIVGAYLNDAGGVDAGRAYVYYGGPGADATADLTLTGATAGNSFGASVSAAGDINGDGYGDVIVGAHLNSAAGTFAGRAYVYYGGAVPNTVADRTLTGAAANDFFGLSVSGPGDVNGDGYDDVMVAAYQNDAGGINAGRVYLYYGGLSGNPVAFLTLTGAAANDLFGSSVSGPGDVNGDGYVDMIVGAPYNDSGGADAGRAYVYYGGPGVDATADLTLDGSAPGDNFGYSVSGAGDANGDGYADVIAGAPVSALDGGNSGRAYVYTARPYEVLSPNGGEQWVIGRQHEIRWAGADLADLWASFDGGASYSILASSVGGAEQNAFPVIVPEPATGSARIRVSASGEAVTHGSSDASDRVFSIVEANVPPAAAHRLQLTPTGAAAGDIFGYSVSTAEDVNGDGYADVIVGAPFNDFGGTDAGRAYVYFGGPGADAVADLTLTGAAAGDQFGYSVSGAGDVNGDGYADAIVGAPNNSSTGRAYVYFGGPGADAVADLQLTGSTAGDSFGNSVSIAGDVNGDGYADVIVGAPFNDFGGPNAGRAYVYFGGPGADAVADLALTGATAGDAFGSSVSTAGDVNGDGYGDLIAGSPINDAGGTDAGRAYVYFGGASPNSVADLTLTGAAAGDYFGFSVSTAGDVNGDGHGDVIVGAYANDAGGSDAGRAYVYFGGPGADDAADLALTGAAAGDNFGIAVSAAGDVNRDGYGDMAVGAYGNSAGGFYAGRAYVYFGGPGADSVADLALTGAAAGDNLGIAVSAAGDVNGDGYGDVIVGGYHNGAGGVNAGRAYVYDMNRYHLLSPNGGETWNVGALKAISWLGAEPADLWLSADGGSTYQLQLARVGGAGTNSVPLRVPHLPTKFARVRLTPSDASIGGRDQSDSTFTIQTSVALLALLAAPAPDRASGAVISWKTDPGPEDLAGYRLERAPGSGTSWSTLVALTRETSVTDPEGGPGSRYRLFAVNGLGEALWLGETSLRPAVPLAAWPLPYRGGNLSIAFATHGALVGGPGPAEVSLFDASGRLVRTVARGQYTAGYQAAVWDGRDSQGRKVGAGVYFLRAASAGEQRSIKFVVLH